MYDTTLDGEPASGRFLLRVPPALHASLRRAARSAGLSLNEYCVRVLASSADAALGPGAIVATRAVAEFGDAFVGVVLHGSWARGEAVATSDVDALVVVTPSSRVTRSTYEAWDRTPLTYDGRELDVHFAVLPEDADAPEPMWLEVAIDGLVAVDRDGRLARYLAAVRRGIASGAWRRHVADGHPYWASN